MVRTLPLIASLEWYGSSACVTPNGASPLAMYNRVSACSSSTVPLGSPVTRTVKSDEVSSIWSPYSDGTVSPDASTMVSVGVVTGSSVVIRAADPPSEPGPPVTTLSSNRLASDTSVLTPSVKVTVTVEPISSYPETEPALPAPSTPWMLFGSMSVVKVNCSPGLKSVKSMVSVSYPPLRGSENGSADGSDGTTSPVTAAPEFGVNGDAMASPPDPVGSNTISGRIAPCRLKVTDAICTPGALSLVRMKLLPAKVDESSPLPGVISTRSDPPST